MVKSNDYLPLKNENEYIDTNNSSNVDNVNSKLEFKNGTNETVIQTDLNQNNIILDLSPNKEGKNSEYMNIKNENDINSTTTSSNNSINDQMNTEIYKLRKSIDNRAFTKWKITTIIVIFVFLLVQCIIVYISLKVVENYEYFKEIPDCDSNLIHLKSGEFNWKDDKNITLEISNLSQDLKGFMFLNENNSNGPITVDKDKDDGSKMDIFQTIKRSGKESSFPKELEAYQMMEEELPKKEEYICELRPKLPSEGQKEFTISCPVHYALSIDYAFYGRHENDMEHCNRSHNGELIEDNYLKTSEDCGYNSLEDVKELCEGKRQCVLLSSNFFFKDSCEGIRKYLHIKYHCAKEKTFRKANRFAVVMFANKIPVNSIYENSISEFYQYSKYYGYDYYLYRYRYDFEREIYYVKLESVLETMIKGLKENKYEWIFWVDSDTILANPTIELDAFVPDDNDVHFIAGTDHNGLNAGVFLIRVHPWSLNFLMRAISYFYYKPNRFLRFADQSSLNNVLTEFDESNHYVIVPQRWFNSYLDYKKDGDFVIHLAGEHNKSKLAKDFRLKLKKNHWYKSKTNDEMRKEVLSYYALPREKQHHIQAQKRK